MIKLGDGQLSLASFKAIVLDDESIEISEAALQRIDASYNFLKEFSSHKLIYGINTGFGPMAQYKISDENILQLQYNLIRSHSSGSGQPISAIISKAVVVSRLNSMLQGFSGVHRNIILLLTDMINKNVVPCIFEHGGVGASGDLVQLAHLGLGLIGEGEVWYQGSLQPTAAVFSTLGLQPLEIKIREGLATINGTSAMTGLGMLNIIQAKQ